MTRFVTIPHETPHIAQLIDAQTNRIMPMPPTKVFDWPSGRFSTMFLDAGVYLQDLNDYLEEVAIGKVSDEYLRWKPELFSGFFTNGLLVFIPDTVCISEPLIVSMPSQISCAANRIIIIAQENARVQIVFDQNETMDTVVINMIHIIAEKDTHVSLNVNNTGALWNNMQITSHLTMSGAHSTIQGIAALDDKQRCSIITQAYHYAPYTTSIVNIKSVCSDSSQFLFQGLIDVEQAAHNTHASQQNKNLLWSAHAKAYAIPSLQVRTNQVKCAHGSATGPVDEEQLWYLQSRGLDYMSALQLLLESFVADVMQPLPQEIQDEYIRRIMYKMCKV